MKLMFNNVPVSMLIDVTLLDGKMIRFTIGLSLKERWKRETLMYLMENKQNECGVSLWKQSFVSF